MKGKPHVRVHGDQLVRVHGEEHVRAHDEELAVGVVDGAHLVEERGGCGAGSGTLVDVCKGSSRSSMVC